ncbi:piggyBac transposable element-derived protein 4 [Biomphalaria glabrata]|nr:piggyBac transposable element-derived protein 4 [Biomphalaria glabrata]
MPGVCPDLLLSDQSSPLDFFHAIFDDRIKDNLINSINSFARKKCQLNNPRKRSVYGRWTDVARSELDKFMAVLIKIGIEKRPAISDYWTTAAEFYAPWIHHVFNRESFQDIYHTMLHCGDEASEGKEKK